MVAMSVGRCMNRKREKGERETEEKQKNKEVECHATRAN